ncbi:MAG: hypothetical protein J5969_02150 [Lachnospiraceae bacterium]|nr:hypothetical protein [Lachnospiraceae bacterium]
MRNGLSLFEERFCQLSALGKTARDAYSEAFSVAVTDKRRTTQVDNRASRLMKRADIISRIAELAGEAKRKNREMWERRGEDLADRLYERVMEADKAGMLLSKGALKGIEVLAKLKGMNAPEETVLKNGGLAENYTPRGVEGMSDADLKAIIDQEERTIDVEAKVEDAAGDSEDEEDD